MHMLAMLLTLAAANMCYSCKTAHGCHHAGSLTCNSCTPVHHQVLKRAQKMQKGKGDSFLGTDLLLLALLHDGEVLAALGEAGITPSAIDAALNEVRTKVSSTSLFSLWCCSRKAGINKIRCLVHWTATSRCVASKLYYLLTSPLLWSCAVATCQHP